MEIAVINESTRISDADVAFATRACAQQAEEFCAAWGIPQTAVAFYARGTAIPVTTTHAMVLVDDIGDPGILGFHDVDEGVIYGRVLVQGDYQATSVTLSHEVLELLGDPRCNEWAPWTGTRMQAREAADRVEGDTYVETATILGETRGVNVSNYLLPSAFVPGSAGPWDRMGRLTSWDGMTHGGYVIVRDEAGNVSNVFASRAVPDGFYRKLVNPRSRTLRRLRGEKGPTP